MYIIFRIIFLVINKNEKNYLSGFSVRIGVFVYLFLVFCVKIITQKHSDLCVGICQILINKLYGLEKYTYLFVRLRKKFWKAMFVRGFFILFIFFFV